MTEKKNLPVKVDGRKNPKINNELPLNQSTHRTLRKNYTKQEGSNLPGGKTSYSVAYPSIARKMMMNGATTTEVASALQVSVPTLYKWMHKYDEFAAAFKLGGPIVDNRVEVSLYEKAVGYKWEEEVISKEYDENGEEVEKVTKVQKQIPPDNSAMFFFLKNRRPNKWKDKVEITINQNLNLVSDAELYQLVADNRVIDGEFTEVKDDDTVLIEKKEN